MTKVWREHRLQAAAALAGLLLAAGCSERETGPCVDGIPLGRIQGHVRIGAAPPAAGVWAKQLGTSGDAEVIFLAEPNTDGSYRMDVPAGRYFVEVHTKEWGAVYGYSADGLRYGDAPPDTLLVEDGDSLVVDFDLGCLDVHVDIPAALDGRRWELELVRRGADTVLWGRTDIQYAAGTIRNGSVSRTIPGVLPGAYRIQLVIGSRECDCDYCYCEGERFWLPGLRDSSLTPWIDVAPGATVDVSAAPARESARIEGEIVGAWLEMGIADPPNLTLLTPDSVAILGPRAVGADGRFAWDLCLPEPVKLRVEHRGVEQWIGGRSFTEAELFPLESGQSLSGIHLAESGVRLNVDAPWPDLGGVRILLFDPIDFSLRHASWTLPEDDLVLALPNVPPGTYLLQFTHGWWHGLPWCPQWFDRAVRPAEARPITISREGEIVTLPILLERGAAIRGAIRNVPQNVPSYFIVYLTPADDRRSLGYIHAFTPDLEIEFTGVPNGDWKAGVIRDESPWYTSSEIPDQPPPETIWYPATPDWDAAEPISVRELQDVGGVEIVMP